MKIIDKVGDSLSQSVDFIIEKNRQAAQLNRLKAIIQNETDNLDNSYITLGKEYIKVLDGGTADEKLVAQLRECIGRSQLRLKKARARYEYTLRYGVPKPGVDVEEAVSEDGDAAARTEGRSDEEEQDITIAYADPTAAIDDDAIDAEPVTAADEPEKTEDAVNEE